MADQGQYITLKEAQYELAQLGIPVTYWTISRWVKTYKMAVQPGGFSCQIYVDKKKWKEFLDEYLKRKI